MTDGPHVHNWTTGEDVPLDEYVSPAGNDFQMFRESFTDLDLLIIDDPIRDRPPIRLWQILRLGQIRVRPKLVEHSMEAFVTAHRVVAEALGEVGCEVVAWDYIYDGPPGEVRVIGYGIASTTDTWAEPTGCWADVWADHCGEYVSCDEDPDPSSDLGLCSAHAAKLDALRAAS